MASQQPPVRPWFRLGSIVRPAPAPAAATPAPDPALAQTRPPVVRPAFMPIAQPQAPAPPAAAAPPQETVAPPPLRPAPSAAPPSPPKIVPTTTAAPKTQPTAETEPKIPVEAEPKMVLVQETIEKPKRSNGDSRKDLGVAKDGETKDSGHPKKLTADSEVRIITITGENRGAFMELIQSAKKHDFEGKEMHNHSSEDGKHKMKDKELNSKAKPVNAYVNNNVQGVNSSLVYNSTCDLHDPGVHFSMPGKLAGGGSNGGEFQIKEHGGNGK